MSNPPRLGTFVFVCFVIAVLAEAGAVAAGHYYPDRAAQFAHINGLIFYGLPVTLCGIAGALMGVWTRRSLSRNVLASLTCFLMPFFVAVGGVYLSCLFMSECLL